MLHTVYAFCCEHTYTWSPISQWLRQTMGLETWNSLYCMVAVAAKVAQMSTDCSLLVCWLLLFSFFSSFSVCSRTSRVLYFWSLCRSLCVYTIHPCVHVWHAFIWGICDLRIIMWANHKNVCLLFLYFNGSENFIANNELIGVTDRAIKCDNIYIVLPLCTIVWPPLTLLWARAHARALLTGLLQTMTSSLSSSPDLRRSPSTSSSSPSSQSQSSSPIAHRPMLFCPWTEIFIVNSQVEVGL